MRGSMVPICALGLAALVGGCSDPQVCGPGQVRNDEGDCVEPCELPEVNCTDGNDCTQDVCTNLDDGTFECSNPLEPDETPCTKGENAGSCVSGECDLCANIECGDGSACTLDGTCNPVTGQCEGGSNAPDGTDCTTGGNPGKCASGTCAGLCTNVTCDDQKECTEDTCDPADGMCDHAPVTDGSRCAGGLCEAGVCRQFDSVFPCTEQGIRDAVFAGGGPHIFACEGPTTVTTQAEINIPGDVILDGLGNLIVDGAGSHRVFSVALARNVTLIGLAVTNGGGVEQGGGIYNEGNLELIDVTVSGNKANDGGGGIATKLAALSLRRCTISGNEARGGGGGILNISDAEPLKGVVKLIGTTVSNNEALKDGSGFGGGIFNAWGTLELVNSTVSGNDADVGGGINSIWVFGGTASLTATHSTVFGNSAINEASALYFNGSVTINNSIIEGDCVPFEPLTQASGNIESPANTCGFPTPANQVGVSATQLNLGPLQDNGGPTLTNAPQTPSAAIDKIGVNDCLDFDQRGVSRPQGALCDIGSVEVAP